MQSGDEHPRGSTHNSGCSTEHPSPSVPSALIGLQTTANTKAIINENKAFFIIFLLSTCTIIHKKLINPLNCYKCASDSIDYPNHYISINFIRSKIIEISSHFIMLSYFNNGC